jgi:plasmid maintenance system antidote protein VapI
MPADAAKSATLKQKAIHEGQEFVGIALYLAFFFCAVVAYSSILLNQFHVSYFSYGTAIINALIIAKVILIGEYAHLGRRHESKPLLESALYKAVMFTILVFAFHIVEELIKALVHKQPSVTAFHAIRLDELVGRSIVVFCTFVPLFAIREIARVLGEEEFRRLFFASRKHEASLPTGKAGPPRRIV